MTTGPRPVEQLSEEIRECEQRLAEVEAENHLLRRAAESFGDLAERLNVQLQTAERRSGKDRREDQRVTVDRRQA